MNPVFVISVTVPVYESSDVSSLMVFLKVWESYASLIFGKGKLVEINLGVFICPKELSLKIY